MQKLWRLHPHDAATVAALAKAAGVSGTVAQLLINRDVTDPGEAKRFLDGPLSDLHPPNDLPNVPVVAELVYAAVKDGQKICVYGDYDADGVTGTAILLRLFKALGREAIHYIPNRMDEGYGVNTEALDALKADGVDLVITVDCGIASLAEAAHAKQIGLGLVITDHHEMKETLPDARGLVHPRLPGSKYPFHGLSGAGVAFKLAWAIAMRASGSERVSPILREYLLDATGLAAMGLVADVMPLRDENRILVRKGLERLVAKPSVGLNALVVASGLGESQSIKAEDVAYKLAPRLNAAGRLGCARLVVELLTTDNPERAKELAEYLNGQNEQRQTIERKIGYQARERIAAHALDKEPVLVLENAEWHAGVIGVVAGRLCEQYAKPTVLIATGNGFGPAAGSGRSVPGCPLHELFAECSELLISHGGHAAAAGLKIEPQNVSAFRERFAAAVRARFPDGTPRPVLPLDAELPLSSLTLGLLKEIQKLEPYGFGNTRPRFLATGLTVEQPKKMGKDERHLSFRVVQNGTSMRAVAFGRGEDFEKLTSAGGKISLAFTPKINEWQGRKNVEVEVVDFVPGDVPPFG
jgi:single-stranded-DNA-specific exonuclease